MSREYEVRDAVGEFSSAELYYEIKRRQYEKGEHVAVVLWTDADVIGKIERNGNEATADSIQQVWDEMRGGRALEDWLVACGHEALDDLVTGVFATVME